MTVSNEFPPIYDQIRAAFPAIRDCKPIFAWGDKIYNPDRIAMTAALFVHEGVHGQRQLGTAEPGTARGEDAIRQWWHRYIVDPRFRLMEELLAHAAEYRFYMNSPTSNRHLKRAALKVMGQRLASPLYGSLISVADAMIAIATPEKPFSTRLREQTAAAI